MHVPVVIREGSDRDWGFVSNSWLMSYMKRATVLKKADREDIDDCSWSELKEMALRLVGRATSRTDPQAYMEYQNRMIEVVLARAPVLVAVNKEDTDQLIGHVVYEKPNILHYVYTKGPFRRLGIARSLIDAALSDAGGDIIVTHWMHLVPKLVRGHVTYNPYRGFYDFRRRPKHQGSEAKAIS